MNDTIETNQNYQKCKEILTPDILFVSGSAPVKCYYTRSSASQPASLLVHQSPDDCYLFDKQSWCTIQYLIAPLWMDY